MYKIAYVFGTRNNPKLIDYYINHVSELFIKYNIGLYIYDGSTNDETKKIMDKYDFSFIHYEFCPQLSLGERIVKGFIEADCEYLCYGGDGQLPNIDNFDKLLSILNENYTLINLSYRDRKNIVKKEYFDIVEMFKDNCWDMTLGGSVFYKKNCYCEINYDNLSRIYSYENFIHLIYYFDFLRPNVTFKGYYEALPIVVISPLKNKSAWSNNVLDVFGVQWSKSIMELDNKYNTYKKSVILDHSNYSSLKLNSIKGFLLLKINHNLSFNDYLKYRNTIKLISRVNHLAIIVISIIPYVIIDEIYSVYKAVKS